MKKTLFLFGILLSFLFFGCQGNASHVKLISQSTTVSYEFLEMYLPEQTIDVFEALPISQTHYVDVEDFIDILQPFLQEITISVDNVMKITYDYMISADSKAIIPFELVLDAKHNTLTFNDFNFNQYIELSMAEYETDIIAIDGLYEGGESEVTISLDDYDMVIIERNHRYYIPIYLANLLLTGSQMETYYTNDMLYVFDGPEELTSLAEHEDVGSDDNQALVDECTNYSKLLFDYYYGLDQPEANNDFSTRIDSYHFNDIDSVLEFNTTFNQFILDLDDMHTSVLSAGGYQQDIGALEISEDSRYYQIYQTYINILRGDRKTYDINLLTYEDFYVLDIVEFNLETKDKLAEYLGTVDDKPIIIDLSTNLGGNIVAVFELLAYMTNDPITFNYTNPATQEFYSETLQSNEPKAIDNSFLVYTSQATYSAANLFVSIVKDNQLAFICGEQTGGGAAAVNYTVLPNHMVISYSSNFLMLNDERESIEFGISPDIVMQPTRNVSGYYDSFIQYMESHANITVSNQSEGNHIDLSIDVSSINEQQVSITNTISVYRETDDVLVDSISSNDHHIDYDYDVDFEVHMYYVEVITTYTLQGITFEKPTFKCYVDSMYNQISEDTLKVDLDQTYQGSFYSEDDIDFICIEIEESGSYQLKLNDYEVYARIFNDSFTFIESDNIYVLTPGTYYIELVKCFDVMEPYELEIVMLYDDNLYDTYFDYQYGTHTVVLTVDFTGDEEAITFDVTEESLLNISFNFEVGWLNPFNLKHILDDYPTDIDYTITNDTQGQSIVLPIGHYIFKPYTNLTAGEYAYTFDISPLESDFSGDITKADINYGTLALGSNEIVFEGHLDQDIYQFTASQSTQLFFNGDMLIYSLEEDGLDIVKQNRYIFLGKNETITVLLKAQNDRVGTYNLHVIEINDTSTPDQMIPLIFGEPIRVVLEMPADIDYYTFTLSRQTTLQIDMSSPIYFDIYDEDNTKIMTIYRSMSFPLPAGNYHLEAYTNYKHYLSTVYTDVFVFNESTVNDLEYNADTLDSSYYQNFTLSPGESIFIHGNIDYFRDVDLFILTLTHTGYIQAEGIAIYGVAFEIYNSKNDFHFYNDRQYLEAGTYFIVVRSINSTITLDYNITLTSEE